MTNDVRLDDLAAALAAASIKEIGACMIYDGAADGGCCAGGPVAVRWEDGFMDTVCDKHAQSARARGALVVYAEGKQP